jgi:hypothetical protein
MKARKMHQSGGEPTMGCKVAANTRLPAATDVNPEQATANPTTYERNCHPNARCVTNAAPAALGYRDASEAYERP